MFCWACTLQPSAGPGPPAPAFATTTLHANGQRPSRRINHQRCNGSGDEPAIQRALLFQWRWWWSGRFSPSLHKKEMLEPKYDDEEDNDGAFFQTESEGPPELDSSSPGDDIQDHQDRQDFIRESAEQFESDGDKKSKQRLTDFTKSMLYLMFWVITNDQLTFNYLSSTITTNSVSLFSIACQYIACQYVYILSRVGTTYEWTIHWPMRACLLQSLTAWCVNEFTCSYWSGVFFGHAVWHIGMWIAAAINSTWKGRASPEILWITARISERFSALRTRLSEICCGIRPHQENILFVLQCLLRCVNLLRMMLLLQILTMRAPLPTQWDRQPVSATTFNRFRWFVIRTRSICSLRLKVIS